jgi:hypothetical protein
MIGAPSEDDPSSKETVYIGECDALQTRFEQHHKQDAADWMQIFLATTTEGTFNKAHARLAEHLLVERARKAGRAKVLNVGTSRPNMDEGDEAFTQEFVENVVTLAQTLGVILFRPSLTVSSPKSSEAKKPSDTTDSADYIKKLPRFRFKYTHEDIPAEMVTDGKDFVVLKGSKARPDSAGLPDHIKEMRETARAQDILTKEAGSSFEVFQQDVPTKSVSAAGALVYGSSCQGPLAWHNVDTGQTYSEWVKGPPPVGSSDKGEMPEADISVISGIPRPRESSSVQ